MGFCRLFFLVKNNADFLDPGRGSKGVSKAGGLVGPMPLSGFDIRICEFNEIKFSKEEGGVLYFKDRKQ